MGEHTVGKNIFLAHMYVMIAQYFLDIIKICPFFGVCMCVYPKSTALFVCFVFGTCTVLLSYKFTYSVLNTSAASLFVHYVF